MSVCMCVCVHLHARLAIFKITVLLSHPGHCIIEINQLIFNIQYNIQYDFYCSCIPALTVEFAQPSMLSGCHIDNQ